MSEIKIVPNNLNDIIDNFINVVKDSHELAGIVEKTYQSRIDLLRDMVTAPDIDTAMGYWRGLMDAYNVVMGHEQKQ